MKLIAISIMALTIVIAVFGWKETHHSKPCNPGGLYCHH